MATILKTKNSVTTTVVPTTLQQGELAVNITDKKMWVGNAATTPVQILGAGATNRAGGSNTQVQYNSSGDLAGSANMVFDGSTLTTLNSAYTGTLTGGTGIVNLGSGQFYKDASGNVGIGTSSPSAKLELAGTTTAVTQKLTATTGPAYTVYGNSGSNLFIGKENSAGGGFGAPAYASIFYEQGAYPMVFYTTSSERMRIDSSGNVGIGTTTMTGKLNVAGNVAIANGGWYGFGDVDERIAGDNSGFMQFFTGGTERMRIDSSGNLLVGATAASGNDEKFYVKTTSTLVANFENNTNTSSYNGIRIGIQANANNTSSYFLWGNNTVANYYLYGNGTSSFTSDARLKKNIETTRNGYIDDLMKLRVVKYNWKNDKEGTPKELGLIAQEVEQVFAGLVQEDLNPVEENGETFKQLKASVLPFILLKAIQEQQTLIENLTTRLNALEGK
jgi:hypothetical protein